MAYQPIENYGVIGDLYTVALVGMDGSIDFMSFPHFDSPTVFAALLDHQKGGHFRVAPVLEDARHKQMYLPDSNILITRFLSREGVAEVSDFMPVEEAGDALAHNLVRRAKTVRGEVHFRMICEPRFDYARAHHRVEQRPGEVVFVSQGPDKTALRLRTTVPVTVENGAAIAEFCLRAGETAAFVLESAEPGMESPSMAPDYVSRAFKDTMNFWHRWLARSTYRGRWREMVNRSALTLKLLTSQRHGSLVAAPTFGLPEEIGGERNWDYRYTWIRDASFTLYGLIRLGFTEEAGAFMRWIEERCGECNPDGTLQIMYGLDGHHDLTESTLTHLEGYQNSSPVRIGNGAYNQLQLDIYGELLDSVYLYNKYGDLISYDFWINLVQLIDWVCDHWHEKDEGIWEVRGGQQEFLYSRLMCWVAVNRGIRLAQKRSFPAPLDRWTKVQYDIYLDVFKNFWDPGRKAFMQHKGATTVDASSLLMPMTFFVGPTDPRWLSTMQAIKEDLVDDSLVYRYKTDAAASDGLSGEEGTFNMCSFWYVECLARAGDVLGARYNFEKMLGYANHLGLYAEELGPRGEHLGNFPQAFTHLGLISAAYNLDRALSQRR
ncbi:MAG: glycoside hydrolase family 15 protein [Candidatus Tectomicrobia bacterium]|nr:glycoside hydrolase family 15 protein [Candidatus Tectomicrobia bacterium]